MSSWALAALLWAALPFAATAQDRERCNFINTDTTRFQSKQTPTGQYNTFYGAGIRVRCPSKELTLIADSLEYYGDEDRIYLLGHVRYDEPRLSLTSDFLTYFRRDERLLATGNVNAKLPNGSTLKGPLAEYYRAIPGTRPVLRVIANGRPTITLQQKDSLGRPAPPATVVADRATMVGDSLVYAGGQVVVTREDIIARGDTMFLDTQREFTALMRNPTIEGRKDRPFTLGGDRIELTGRNRKLDKVLSIGKARAISEDMTLASDTIDIRVSNDLLQRAVAWGPSRARGTSTTQKLVADSIDVLMPGQRLREMHAVRDAYGEGRPDTVRFRADTVDWLRGDTIIARFDTARYGDTTRAAKLRELVSVGKARAYYHLAPADTSMRDPAINYVVGREITIAINPQDQKVSKVTVRDRAAGVYLEPKKVAAKPDSSNRRSPAATKAPPPARTAPPPIRRPR